MGAVGEKARAEDHVGDAVSQGLQQALQIQGVVFEIRILNGDEVTPGLCKARAQCGALAHVAGVADEVHLPVRVGQAFSNSAAVVARAIVDDDDLELQGGVLDREQTLDAGCERPLLVVTGNDDAQRRPRFKSGSIQRSRVPAELGGDSS